MESASIATKQTIVVATKLPLAASSSASASSKKRSQDEVTAVVRRHPKPKAHIPISPLIQI
jgi:hypothetical protein